jgi:hypothetical protein
LLRESRKRGRLYTLHLRTGQGLHAFASGAAPPGRIIGAASVLQVRDA